MPPLPADSARWMGAQVQASPASPSTTGEVDGRAARARKAARVRRRHAGEGCGRAAPAMKKTSGTVFFLEKPCSSDGHGLQPKICVRALEDKGESSCIRTLEDKGERRAERMIYRSRTG
jgi:hypothetical protein